MASNEVGDVYRRWVDAINARDWTTAKTYLAPSLTCNGEEITSEKYLAELQESIDSSHPDDALLIDMVITDPASGAIAARLIHHGTLTKPLQGAQVTGSPIEWSEHVLAWLQDGKIVRLQSLTDAAALRKGDAALPRTPELQQRPPPPGESLDLVAKYNDYIAVVNTHKVVEGLPPFYSPTLTHNNKELVAAELFASIEKSFDAMEDLTLKIEELIVDEASQRVAARLEFNGKFVKEFFGFQPTGKEGGFGEFAFYQLDQGKITFIWVVVDFTRLQ